MPLRRATLFNLLAIGMLLGLAELVFARIKSPGSVATIPTTTALALALGPTPGAAPTVALTDTLAWIWWEGPRSYVTEQQRRMASGGGTLSMWVAGGPLIRLDQSGRQHPIATGVIRTVPRQDQAPLLIVAPEPSGSFTITDPLNGQSVPVDINLTAPMPKELFADFSLDNPAKTLDGLSLSPDGALLAHSFFAYDPLDRLVRYDDEIGLTDLRTGVTATLYPGISIRRREDPRSSRWLIGWRGHRLYGGWKDGERTAIWSFDSDTRDLNEHAWDVPAGGALAQASPDWIIYSLPADQEGLRDYRFMPWGGEPRRLGRYEARMKFAVSPAPPWRIAFITPPWRAEPPDTALLLLGDFAGEFAPRVISDSLDAYSSVEWLSERYLSLHDNYGNDHASLFDGVTGDPVAVVPFDRGSGRGDQAAGPDDRVLSTVNNCAWQKPYVNPTPILFHLEVLGPGRATPDRLELGPAPVETSSWVKCVPPRIVYAPGAR